MGFLKNPKGAIYGAKITRDLVFSWHFHRGIEILKYHENIRSRVISAALMVPLGINKAHEKQIFEAEIQMLENPRPPNRNPIHQTHLCFSFLISHLKEKNCITMHIYK